MTAPSSSPHVDVERTIAATPAALYKAWTDPGSIRRWFAPGMIVRECEIACSVGGKYRFVCAYADGRECTVRGEFLVVEPDRKLVYSWTVEGTHEDVQNTLVTVEFTPVENATRIRILHERLDTPGARKGTTDGWTEILALLERLHEIDRIERESQEIKKKLVSLRKALPRTPVKDAALKTVEGASVMLSELFAGKDELLIIHNMGKSCPYCTLWADGFNGVHEHLSNRAAFIVLTPDEPKIAKEFAASRKWGFRLISAQGTTTIRDMGFEPEPGRVWPGLSTLKKNADGSIVRTATTHFGPWDDYCGVWAMIEMLERGENNWQPKYVYG